MTPEEGLAYSSKKQQRCCSTPPLPLQQELSNFKRLCSVKDCTQANAESKLLCPLITQVTTDSNYLFRIWKCLDPLLPLAGVEPLSSTTRDQDEAHCYTTLLKIFALIFRHADNKSHESTLSNMLPELLNNILNVCGKSFMKILQIKRNAKLAEAVAKFLSICTLLESVRLKSICSAFLSHYRLFDTPLIMSLCNVGPTAAAVGKIVSEGGDVTAIVGGNSNGTTTTGRKHIVAFATHLIKILPITILEHPRVFESISSHIFSDELETSLQFLSELAELSELKPSKQMTRNLLIYNGMLELYVNTCNKEDAIATGVEMQSKLSCIVKKCLFLYSQEIDWFPSGIYLESTQNLLLECIKPHTMNSISARVSHQLSLNYKCLSWLGFLVKCLNKMPYESEQFQITEKINDENWGSLLRREQMFNNSVQIVESKFRICNFITKNTISSGLTSTHYPLVYWSLTLIDCLIERYKHIKTPSEVEKSVLDKLIPSLNTICFAFNHISDDGTLKNKDSVVFGFDSSRLESLDDDDDDDVELPGVIIPLVAKGSYKCKTFNLQAISLFKLQDESFFTKLCSILIGLFDVVKVDPCHIQFGWQRLLKFHNSCNPEIRMTALRCLDSAWRIGCFNPLYESTPLNFKFLPSFSRFAILLLENNISTYALVKLLSRCFICQPNEAQTWITHASNSANLTTLFTRTVTEAFRRLSKNGSLAKNESSITTTTTFTEILLDGLASYLSRAQEDPLEVLQAVSSVLISLYGPAIVKEINNARNFEGSLRLPKKMKLSEVAQVDAAPHGGEEEAAPEEAAPEEAETPGADTAASECQLNWQQYEETSLFESILDGSTELTKSNVESYMKRCIVESEVEVVGMFEWLMNELLEISKNEEFKTSRIPVEKFIDLWLLLLEYRQQISNLEDKHSAIPRAWNRGKKKISTMKNYRAQLFVSQLVHDQMELYFSQYDGPLNASQKSIVAHYFCLYDSETCTFSDDQYEKFITFYCGSMNREDLMLRSIIQETTIRLMEIYDFQDDLHHISHFACLNDQRIDLTLKDFPFELNYVSSQADILNFDYNDSHTTLYDIRNLIPYIVGRLKIAWVILDEKRRPLQGRPQSWLFETFSNSEIITKFENSLDDNWLERFVISGSLSIIVLGLSCEDDTLRKAAYEGCALAFSILSIVAQDLSYKISLEFRKRLWKQAIRDIRDTRTKQTRFQPILEDEIQVIYKELKLQTPAPTQRHPFHNFPFVHSLLKTLKNSIEPAAPVVDRFYTSFVALALKVKPAAPIFLGICKCSILLTPFFESRDPDLSTIMMKKGGIEFSKEVLKLGSDPKKKPLQSYLRSVRSLLLRGATTTDDLVWMKRNPCLRKIFSVDMIEPLNQLLDDDSILHQVGVS